MNSQQNRSYSPRANYKNFLFSQRVYKPGCQATDKIIALTAKHPTSQHFFAKSGEDGQILGFTLVLTLDQRV